jgi:hypothetical protein
MGFPLVNNRVYDFSSIEVVLPSGIIKGFTEISYSDTIDHGEFRGAAPHALALTNGEYAAEASITMEKQLHVLFMLALKTLSIPFGGQIHAVRFPIIVKYSGAGLSMPLVTDKLLGCAYGGTENSHSQGSDALVSTVPLAVRGISWNGVNALGTAALDLGI